MGARLNTLKHEGFLEYASKRMIRYAHSEKFMRWVCRYLLMHLQPVQVSVAIYDPSYQSFCISVSEGRYRIPSRLISLTASSPLIQWFFEPKTGSPRVRRSHRLITQRHVSEKSGDMAHQILEELLRHHVDVCIRIETRDKLAGYLLIGEREDGVAYSEEDMTFFQILANDIGIEIEKEEYLHHSRNDYLTGLYNRTTLQETLDTLCTRFRQGQLEFGAAMIDIDNFKKINDAYGHLVGDQVIRCVADFIRAGTRKTDTAFRYGGEEFLILFRKTSRNPHRRILDEEFKNDITLVVDRLRQKVSAYPVACLNHQIPLSVSIGLTFLHPGSSNPDSLIAEADHALYTAKNTGKNKVVLFEKTEPERDVPKAA